jgi:hypothetical protein
VTKNLMMKSTKIYDDDGKKELEQSYIDFLEG